MPGQTVVEGHLGVDVPDVEDGVAIIRGGGFRDLQSVGALDHLGVAEGPEVAGRCRLQLGRGEARVDSVIAWAEVGQQGGIAAGQAGARHGPAVGRLRQEPDRVAVREVRHGAQHPGQGLGVCHVALAGRIPAEGLAEDLVDLDVGEGLLRRCQGARPDDEVPAGDEGDRARLRRGNGDDPIADLCPS